MPRPDDPAGLFDCHTHVCISNVDLWGVRPAAVLEPVLRGARRTSSKTLAIGITSVRDAGGADLGIKEAVADGMIAGPRIQISIIDAEPDRRPRRRLVSVRAPRSRCFVPHPGRPSGIVDGAGRDAAQGPRAAPDGRRRDQGRDLRRRPLARDDPRHAHFRPAELEVLVEEATAAGMFVMAHAQGADGIKNAVRAGIRSIDHGIYLDDEAIELMLRARELVRADARRPAGGSRRGRCGGEPAAGRRRQGPDGDRHPPSGVPAGRRGRRPDRDGHRQRRHAARPEPARAPAHGRRRDGARARSSRRRPGSAAQLHGRRRRPGHDRAEGKLADLVVVAGDPYDFTDLADRVEQVWQDGRRAI